MSDINVDKKSSNNWKRISSIVRSLALLFDNPLLGMEINISDEYEELVNPEKPLSLLRINRLISLLNSYKELFGSGSSYQEKIASQEVIELRAWLKAIRLEQEQSAIKARLNPKNLGLSFIKKNYGSPLFGLLRPPKPPTDRGLLLCYQAKEINGNTLLYATRNSPNNIISYTEIGTKITSKSLWSSVFIFSLPIEEDFNFPACDSYLYDRFLLNMALGKSSSSELNLPEVWEPNEFRYIYYFYDNSAIFIKLRQFLTGLLSGLFSIPSRESENIASIFAQRSL